MISRCSAGPAEAREHLQLHREGRQSLTEGAEMLLCQHGGGHQHGHLFTVHHCLEGCPQRHLGLAVAHVAADQAVHRARLLHVGFDFAQHRSWSSVSM